MTNNTLKSVSIIGLGWFGTPLAHALKEKFEIYGTTRSAEKVSDFLSRGIKAETLDESGVPSSELMNSDIIVLNIPPFRNQLKWFQSWNWKSSSKIYFISSTSVYGDQEGLLDETTPPVPNTEGGQILVDEEQWFKSFPNCTIIRFGGLFGEGRHPGKFLAGRKDLDKGNWPVNLVHLNDCVSFLEHLIKEEITGETFNLVHPDHPSRESYYTTYCKDHQLAPPQFRPDHSIGKTISSSKVLQIHQFRAGLF